MINARVLSVRDYVLKENQVLTLWVIVENLRTFGYTETEIRLGVRLALELM